MADFFSEDFDEDDELDIEKETGALKEAVVLLIDLHPDMLDVCTISDNEFTGLSWLEASIKVAASMVRTKALQGGIDEVGIAFFNSGSTVNQNNMGGICVEQARAPPDITRILSLRSLHQDEVLRRVGVGSADPATFQRRVEEALQVAQNMLPGVDAQSKKDTPRLIQRVIMFTRDQGPQGEQLGSAATRAEIMADVGIRLQLAALKGPDESFDLPRFWGPLLDRAAARLSSSSPARPPSSLAVPTTPAAAAEEGVYSMGEDDDEQQVISVETMVDVVRMRALRKRALTRINWTLGPGGIVVGVKLYSTVKPAWPSTRGNATLLDSETQKRLVTERVLVDSLLGLTLDATQKPRLVYPAVKEVGAANEQRFPRVVFGPDEIKEAKYPLPKGIHLLGFLPASALSSAHQLREPSFVYPDEKSIHGSMKAFVALHDALLNRDQVAICVMVRSPSAEPRLVAAVAQQEVVVGDTGAQVEPPGINLIYLPFMDDFRRPEQDVAWTGVQHRQPSTAALQATAKMTAMFPLGEDFGSADIPNPHLQLWFKVLEDKVLEQTGKQAARAGMGDDEEEQESDEEEQESNKGEEEIDYTLPSADDFEAPEAEEAIQDFWQDVCACVPSEALKGARAKGEKRKTPAPSDVDVDALNIPKLAAEKQLSSLTVDKLKAYLASKGLTKGGKKAELVERIELHLEGTGGGQN